MSLQHIILFQTIVSLFLDNNIVIIFTSMWNSTFANFTIATAVGKLDKTEFKFV